MEIEYEFAIYEMPGKLCVAGGTAPTVEEAEKEGMHYLSQYANDDQVMRYELYKVTRECLGHAETSVEA